MDLAISVHPSVQSSIQRSLSLSEFAESYENALNENRDLACRLSESMHESARLKELHERASLEFGAEKDRLNLEIEQLRTRLKNRLELVTAAKEKLIRDEIERKLQEGLETKLKLAKVELEQKIHSLQMELKQERTQIEKLKKLQAHCICRFRDVLPANWIKR